jgi:dihydroxyacetone kinase
MAHTARVAEDAARPRQLIPKIGRARPLAEKSYGTPDAGVVPGAGVPRRRQHAHQQLTTIDLREV